MSNGSNSKNTIATINSVKFDGGEGYYVYNCTIKSRISFLYHYDRVNTIS